MAPVPNKNTAAEYLLPPPQKLDKRRQNSKTVHICMQNFTHGEAPSPQIPP